MTVVGTLARADGIQLCDDNSDGPPATVTGGSGLEMREIQLPVVARKKVRFVLPKSPQMDTSALEELSELKEAREAGMAFIMGHTHVRAKSGSGLIKRLVIDVGYDFLKRNSRGPAAYALSIPHASTLEVGMICHV